ncbi:MAG TPA: hypothetical protein VKE70_11260, partial [Candidatus Solibacter sp.]|nr:hypothetical protein [Candidatus Solibacter sp.]
PTWAAGSTISPDHNVVEFNPAPEVPAALPVVRMSVLTTHRKIEAGRTSYSPLREQTEPYTLYIVLPVRKVVDTGGTGEDGGEPSRGKNKTQTQGSKHDLSRCSVLAL